jgi:single-strand DNA-binding protein
MINMGQILGRVGKIDTKKLNAGNQVTNLSMVTSKKFTKDGEKQEKVTWHNVTMFGKLSEIAEKYVLKGDLLYIQGEMDNQKYTGQDGIEKTKAFIIAHELKLMPKSKEHKPEQKPDANFGAAFEDDQEVPF